MQKIIKLIMLLALVTIIIVIVTVTNLIKIKNGQNETVVEINEIEREAPAGAKLENEETNEFYYSIKDIISEYYTQISNMNAGNRELSEVLPINTPGLVIEEEELERLKEYVKEDAKKSRNDVYYRLGKEYINEYGITLENVDTKLEDVKFEDIIITEMFVTNELHGVYTYFVKGNIIIKNSTDIKETQLMIIVDRSRSCFSIYPQEYVKKHNYDKVQLGEEIVLSENKNEIEKNEYNLYSFKTVTSQNKAEDLLKNLGTIIEYTPNEALNRINQEYLNARFENKTEALEYLKEKGEKINYYDLDSYTVEEKNGYTQYTCIDTKGNCYIFNESSPLNYTVKLDNYTILTDEFIKEYKQCSESEKVIINIKRFFDGINDKNYGYSYNLLSEAFRKNKYPTKDSFIDYAKQNFFKENEIQYVSYQKNNGLYVYKIKVTNATQEHSEEKEFNIIVKLKGETDFELSFGEK